MTRRVSEFPPYCGRGVVVILERKRVNGRWETIRRVEGKPTPKQLAKETQSALALARLLAIEAVDELFADNKQPYYGHEAKRTKLE